MIRDHRLSLGALFVGVTLLTGCNDDAIGLFNSTVGQALGLKLQTSKGQKPAAQSTEASDPLSGDHRKMNAEFIHEMFRVTLNRNVRNKDEFEKYMYMLDQGGHYEGIYNGIVYASEYRDLEKGIAPVSALKDFAEILAQILLDQKYDPLKIQKPDAASESQATIGDAKPQQPNEAERLALVGEVERESITKSTYYLKRRLGEELLKTIDLKKEYREKLATWYARFTVYMNKKGVDFAVPLRNKQDEYFHYKWALTADEDRLKWECINRAHRLINQRAGLREPPAPPTQTQPQATPPPAPPGASSQAK